MDDKEKLKTIKNLCKDKKADEDIAEDMLMDGGNGQIDDAFYAGQDYGQGQLAEDIMNIIEGD